MSEFHELSDAEIWAQVDAAWLLEQFRRNEISEERERKATIHGHEIGIGVNWERLADAFRHAAAQYAAYLDAVIRATQDYKVGMTASEAMQLEGWLSTLEPGPRRDRSRQAHGWTLRTAFHDQARATRNTRPCQRRHQVQHRD